MRKLRGLRDPTVPLRTMVQRVSKWVGPDRFTVADFQVLAQRMRKVEKDSAMHLVTGVLRVLCRGVCTSSLLHTTVVGCAFGCPLDVANDDLRHYRVCPKLKAGLADKFPRGGLLRTWAAALTGEDWLLTLCCLGPQWGRSRDLVGCALIYCFLAAHNARRTGSVQPGDFLIKPRLRQLSRRHPRLNEALRALRAPAAAAAPPPASPAPPAVPPLS
jgi:hypothetical protein